MSLSQTDKTLSNTNKRTKIAFTAKEDQLINHYVNLIGTKKWTFIAKHVEGRTAKQCRDRYMNYLKPGLSNIEWTQEEDDYLLDLYTKYGPKWSTINKYFQNRNQTSLKNRFRFLQRYIDSDQRNINHYKKNNFLSHSNKFLGDTKSNDYGNSIDEIISLSQSTIHAGEPNLIKRDSTENTIGMRNNGLFSNFEMIIGSDEDFSSFSLMNSDDDFNF